MDGLIIDTAVIWMAKSLLDIELGETELVGKVRRFMESLMTTSYERRVSEIAVTVQQTQAKHGIVPVQIEELLTSKKTRALFAGHRHLLMCNVQGEAYGYRTLAPYPDVRFPKNSALYPAPYEYQPILKFSQEHKALTFLLTRRREIMVILGASIVLVRDEKGWRILALETFIDTLSDRLWRNSKRRLSKTKANTFAIYLTMLCLSLRQHGKGGLLVIYRSGTQFREFARKGSVAETFYQDVFRNRSIVDIPVSMLTNAVAVDGATLLTWEGRLCRFGVVINTQRFPSSSEGARTRAAEFISSKAVAVKISEDGPITIFASRKELITI